MSRILFAAARGARIEADYKGEWYLATYFHLPSNIYVYRIHPEDKHLQYGPISTALREMAEDDSWKPCPYRVLANVAANKFQVYLGGIRDDYPLFYLILAEFLADEGM